MPKVGASANRLLAERDRVHRPAFWDGANRHDAEVQLYAFDVLALDGDDLRQLPLHLRKNHLARLLARRIDGIFINPFKQGEISPDLIRHASKFGLEGLVSKHRERAYRAAGPSPNWIKG
jgi:bifunctional non-homologous end joining protein LigD